MTSQNRENLCILSKNRDSDTVEQRHTAEQRLKEVQRQIENIVRL